MSSYLTVKLKEKGKSHKNAVVLLEISTTPTRELADSVDFVYCGGVDIFNQKEPKQLTEEEILHNKEYDLYTVLTKEKLDEILNFYTSEISDMSKQIAEDKLEVEKLEKNQPQAVSTEIFNLMQEKIDDILSNISYLEEEIEDKEYLKNLWEFCVKKVFERNAEFNGTSKYELIYYRN